MTLNSLIGNSRIKRILSGYLKNDLIPCSMIFFGPSATDMIGFAKGLTKAINCSEQQHDFCDHCTSCREINKDIFLDLQILAPDGQFYKKDQILVLIEDSYKKPFHGVRKTYILKDAHKMNVNAANTFLKVLEEPALANIFILMTGNLNGILPTVKSRCQILKFTQLSKEEITGYLVSNGVEPGRAKLLSYLGQGNLENIRQENLGEFIKKRSETLVILIKLIKKSEIEDVLLDLSARSRSRGKFVEYLKELINLISLMLRDIIVLQIEENSDFLINMDYKETLLKLTREISVEKALFLIRKMEFLLRDIQRNLNSRVLIIEFIKSFITTVEEKSV